MVLMMVFRPVMAVFMGMGHGVGMCDPAMGVGEGVGVLMGVVLGKRVRDHEPSPHHHDQQGDHIKSPSAVLRSGQMNMPAENYTLTVSRPTP